MKSTFGPLAARAIWCEPAGSDGRAAGARPHPRGGNDLGPGGSGSRRPRGSGWRSGSWAPATSEEMPRACSRAPVITYGSRTRAVRRSLAVARGGDRAERRGGDRAGRGRRERRDPDRRPVDQARGGSRRDRGLGRQDRHRRDEPVHRGLRDRGPRIETSTEFTRALVPGARVVKAFNTLFYKRLATEGKPKGEQDRLAIPVASDDPAAKRVVMDLIEEIGFDAVDNGGLVEGGRKQQPGSPIYNQPWRQGDARPARARRRYSTMRWVGAPLASGSSSIAAVSASMSRGHRATPSLTVRRGLARSMAACARGSPGATSAANAARSSLSPRSLGALRFAARIVDAVAELGHLAFGGDARLLLDEIGLLVRGAFTSSAVRWASSSVWFIESSIALKCEIRSRRSAISPSSAARACASSSSVSDDLLEILVDLVAVVALQRLLERFVLDVDDRHFRHQRSP